MHTSTLTSPIITLVVGREQRLFAAHEDVLSLSPFFTAALRGQFFENASKRVELPDEYERLQSMMGQILTVIFQRARNLFLRPRIPLQGRLLPTPVAQQASQLLGARRRKGPSQSRWSRICGVYNLSSWRGRGLAQRHGHLLHRREVWLGRTEAPFSSETRSSVRNPSRRDLTIGSLCI